MSKFLIIILNYLWWLGRICISSTLDWGWLRAAKISLAPCNRITFYFRTGSFSLKQYMLSTYSVSELIDLKQFCNTIVMLIYPGTNLIFETEVFIVLFLGFCMKCLECRKHRSVATGRKGSRSCNISAPFQIEYQQLSQNQNCL